MASKYMMKEKAMHAKGGKTNAQHERGESKKMKLVEKMAEAKAKKRGMQ
jgi:hypothetical protein